MKVRIAQRLRKAAKEALRRNGYDVARGINKFYRLLERYNVDLVLDVGANVGQFGSSLRDIGYTGRIVSFEPLAGAYAQLAAEAQNDPFWDTQNIGLADYDGTGLINRSKRTVFSSLAGVNSTATRVYEGAAVVAQEQIEVRRLESVFSDVRRDSRAVLLKSDTQGFEKQVLQGASGCLTEIAGLHLELSYEPLYEGELMFDAMVQYVRGLGFELLFLEPLLHRETNRILQGNGTFFRLR